MASEAIEAPVYPGAEITYNEEMESSEKGKFTRGVELQVDASPEEVLAFYQNSSAIAECEKNALADNYKCEFAKGRTITSGMLFVDSKKKNGKIEVYMDYFYWK